MLKFWSNFLLSGTAAVILARLWSLDMPITGLLLAALSVVMGLVSFADGFDRGNAQMVERDFQRWKKEKAEAKMAGRLEA